MGLRYRGALIVAMVAALSVVGLVAIFQERRESAAALDDFAREQTLTARALLVAAQGPPHEGVAERLFEAIGRPAGRVVLVAPDGARFRPASGAPELPELDEALRTGRSSLQIPGPRAPLLGLPARMAVAGIARGDRLAVAIVSTAAHERDRGRRAPTRIITSLLLAAGLVIGFGGYALYSQRKELGLERELALAELRSERDARLERLRRVATLGTLSMGVAHELATPLGVIALRAEQLSERPGQDDRGRHALAVIQAQCELIGQTIRGLLTLARGGSPAMEPVAPDAIARDAIDLVEHRFATARVALRAVTPAGLPRVQVDRRLVAQALVNLLLNACDACAAGGHVRLEASANGATMRFAVSDDGAGISPEVTRRLSEPLFTTKPEGEGTGLGLAIVAEIVKSHQGRLEIASGPAGGTIAAIVLPLAAAKESS